MIINEFLLLKFIKKFKNWRGGAGSLYFKLSQSRNYKIPNSMVGFYVAVYNGKVYIPIKVVKNMVGHCFGVFAFSYAIWVKKKKK